MNVYRSGQVVPLTFEVVDPVTGELTNPTTATLSIRRDGAPVAAPAMTNTTTGVYTVDYLNPDAGVYEAVFTTTGTLAGVLTDGWVIEPADLAVVTLAQLRAYLGTTSATDADILDALAVERSDQARTCNIDAYTAGLRGALMRRVARNLAGRRLPTAQVNSFGQSGSGAGNRLASDLSAEIDRLERPYRSWVFVG